MNPLAYIQHLPRRRVIPQQPIRKLASHRPEGAALAQLNNHEWEHPITINGVLLKNMVFGTKIEWKEIPAAFLSNFNCENSFELIDGVFIQRTWNRLTGDYRIGCPCGRNHLSADSSNTNNPNPAPPMGPSLLGKVKRRRKRGNRRSKRVGCPFYVNLRFSPGWIEIRGKCLTHLHHPRSNQVTQQFKMLTLEQRDDLVRQTADGNWTRDTLRRAAEAVVEGKPFDLKRQP